MNLILNARDAMPFGGRVTVCTALAAHANGAGPEAPALLRVEDTGIGMDEATRERAFDPYFTTKAAGKGTGLGLSTVHDVVTRHGGHVEVASTPGRGATFTVTLPRARAAAGPTVLVVEEEAGVRELIVEILELHCFRALPASDRGDDERQGPDVRTTEPPRTPGPTPRGSSTSCAVRGWRRARSTSRAGSRSHRL